MNKYIYSNIIQGVIQTNDIVTLSFSTPYPTSEPLRQDGILILQNNNHCWYSVIIHHVFCIAVALVGVGPADVFPGFAFSCSVTASLPAALATIFFITNCVKYV